MMTPLRTATARAVPSTARTFSCSALLRNTAAPASTPGELKITELLTKKFAPGTLKVQDVSGGCGSFYAIEMSSKMFNGLTPIKAHRLVNQELKDVIKDIHGLQLKTVAEE